MHAAFPMDDQHDLRRFGVHVGDDFVDQRSHDALLQTRVAARIVPYFIQIGGQLPQFATVRNNRQTSGRLMAGDALFQFLNLLQCLIPATFQFLGHEPIVRVGGLVLLLRTAGRIAGRFQIALERRQDVVAALGRLLTGHESCLHCGGLHDGDDLVADGRIHGNAAERDALWLSLVQMTSDTAVAKKAASVARVMHSQLATAPPTTQDARQQRQAPLGRPGWR
jgi:hypothetical protein